MSLLGKGKRKRNKTKTTTVTVNPDGSKTYSQTTVKSRERTTNRGRAQRKPLPPVTTLKPYGPNHDTPLSATITPKPITAQPIKKLTRTVTEKPKIPATPTMSNRQVYRSVR